MLRHPDVPNKEVFDRVLEQVRERQDMDGFGLKKTARPALKFEQDRSGQSDVIVGSDENAYRNGNVPIVAYGGKKTQYLATTNPYLKAPIRPGATPDSTFLFSGESERNNVAGDEPVPVASEAEVADPSSSGAGAPAPLRQVKVAWDTKAVRDRFGAIGVPTPTPIPERSADTPQ